MNNLKQHIETRGEYCEKYDAFYNPKKNIWLEEKCNDPNCIFCKGRPNKPSEVSIEDGKVKK